jgi:hypothetical protein
VQEKRKMTNTYSYKNRKVIIQTIELNGQRRYDLSISGSKVGRFHRLVDARETAQRKIDAIAGDWMSPEQKAAHKARSEWLLNQVRSLINDTE